MFDALCFFLYGVIKKFYVIKKVFFFTYVCCTQKKSTVSRFGDPGHVPTCVKII